MSTGAHRLSDILANADPFRSDDETPRDVEPLQDDARTRAWLASLDASRPSWISAELFNDIVDRFERYYDVDSAITWVPGDDGTFAVGTRAGEQWVYGRKRNGATVFAKLPADQSSADAAPATSTALVGRSLGDLLRAPIRGPDWLIEDTLEQEVIAIIAGPRGSYKSFLALDWSMRVALSGKGVVVISAEGRDFNRRAAAWLQVFAPQADPAKIPVRVTERRLDLTTDEGLLAVRAEGTALQEQFSTSPRLFVCDTFSKLSGNLEENENTAVKQFIGRLDNGLKRAFSATVLLVAHTGHGDKARPRGASALMADTEAEYIVSRSISGQMLVSRERFKSSPEMPALCYEPRIVELGRDETGKAITSLALHSVAPRDAKASPRSTSKPHMGADETTAAGVVEQLFKESNGEPVPIEKVTSEALRRKALRVGSTVDALGRDALRNMRRSVNGAAVKLGTFAFNPEAGDTHVKLPGSVVAGDPFAALAGEDHE